MQLFALAFCALSAILVCISAAPGGRIAGGDDAVLGQIPYQAYLDIAGLRNCGAVILSERYALTELECVCSKGSNRPWPPQMFSVTAGTTDLYTGGTGIVVEEIIINPNYSELNTGIALLKLRKPFVFSDTIQAIELSSVNPPADAEVEISGWGRMKDTDEDMHRTLQLNEATVVDNLQCSRTLGAKIGNDVICLGHARKNGICNGDFGGPAVYQGKLVGIGAYIVGECGSALPDVFTSVASNYHWIVEQMTQ